MKKNPAKPPPGRTITAQERQQATGDVFYEASMLYTVYCHYWAVPGKRPDLSKWPWLHNCAVESTLVHVRALLDFFEKTRTPSEGKPPRVEDVLAEDYGMPHFKFSEIPGEIRNRINTRIMHISYGRTRVLPSERNWRFESFIPHILKRAARFFEHLIGANIPRSSFPGDKRLRDFIAAADAVAIPLKTTVTSLRFRRKFRPTKTEVFRAAWNL